jgi:hypothetical protein
MQFIDNLFSPTGWSLLAIVFRIFPLAIVRLILMFSIKGDTILHRIHNQWLLAVPGFGKRFTSINRNSKLVFDYSSRHHINGNGILVLSMSGKCTTYGSVDS